MTDNSIDISALAKIIHTAIGFDESWDDLGDTVGINRSKEAAKNIVRLLKQTPIQPVESWRAAFDEQPLAIFRKYLSYRKCDDEWYMSNDKYQVMQGELLASEVKAIVRESGKPVSDYELNVIMAEGIRNNPHCPTLGAGSLAKSAMKAMQNARIKAMRNEIEDQKGK